MNDWKPTRHTVNAQNLVLCYLGDGEWFVGQYSEEWKLVGDKRVYFSGSKQELIVSLRG